VKLRIKILLTAFLILFPLVLSGCWDYEEYEDLIQVEGLGIDYDKESREIRLTFEYTPTTTGQTGKTDSSGSSAQKTQIVHSATDETLLDILPKLQQVIYKKIFFGYLKVIVISEEAAKYNMANIIIWLDRTPVLRSTVLMVVTPGTAEETLSTLDAGNLETSSKEIFNIINLSQLTGAAYPVSVHDLAQMMTIPGIEATVPRVITVSKKNKPDAKGGIEGNIKYDIEREGDHRVAGLAAFKGDKFAGWMDEKECLGFGWITGKKITTYKVSEESTDTENVLYFRVIKSKSKIKVQIDKDKPEFQVNVKVNADIRKYYSNQGSDDFLSIKEISDMEKKLSDSIRSDIEAALKRGQKELKSDIFGFGFALFRKDPKLWRTEFEGKWDDLYPDLSIKINVEAKIINTGTSNRKFKFR